VEALPRSQRIALFAGIFVLIVGSFIYFFYFPKIAEIKKLSDKHEKLVNQLDAAKKNAATLESFEAKMKKAEKEFELAVKALPNSQEIPTLLSSISDSGKKSGLQFKLFQPKGARRKGFYAEIPVSISVVGGYHNIAMFFQKVAELDRIVNIRNVTMKRSKGPKLSVSCQAVTYQFVKEKPKKKKKRKKKRR
jgi:type IV pilus assembly protein PilO